MTDEISDKRKHALELMKHPLNRPYFQNVLNMLKDGGVYGWIAMEEVFSKEEIKKALERKDAKACIESGQHLTSCDDDGYCSPDIEGKAQQP